MHRDSLAEVTYWTSLGTNDYELDNSVDFLMNGAVQEALNSPE